MTKAHPKPNIVSIKSMSKNYQPPESDGSLNLMKVTFDCDVVDAFGFAKVTIEKGGAYYFYSHDEITAYIEMRQRIDIGGVLCVNKR